MRPTFVRTSGDVLKFVRKTKPTSAPKTSDLGYSPMGEEPVEQKLLPPVKTIAPAFPKTTTRIATPLPKANKPIGQMNPQELAQYRQQAADAKAGSQAWLQQNPASPQNIINHWNQTTPEHKAQGMSWYPDAHTAAVTIGKDKGISTNAAAGLIANYSPQQHWAQNLRMASLAAGGQQIGGKKIPGQEGFMASASQAQAAQRILGGEDYHNIFAGQKIKAFGHLIENGGDTDPNNPQVVVDRHALGVAHGGYADDGVYTHSGVSSKASAYNNYSQMYKDAADQINAAGGHNGVPIQPHQLQAATWLTRQRLNTEGGYSNDQTAPRVQAVAEANTNKWNAYAAINHPSLVNKVPGTGFSAATQQGGEQGTLPQAVASWARDHWTEFPGAPMQMTGDIGADWDTANKTFVNNKLANRRRAVVNPYVRLSSPPYVRLK